jgi:hypothetical protein
MREDEITEMEPCTSHNTRKNSWSMRRFFLFSVVCLCACVPLAQAQDEALVKEANRLFAAGQFQQAYGAFSQLVSLNPTHGEYNYKFGACSVYADADKTKAIRYLKLAIKYNVTDPMAHYYLGRALHLNYQFKEAQDSYKLFISRANPKSKMISVANLDMKAAAHGSTLLSNIKDITVLSKTETDRLNFFRYYNLEDIGGRILSLPDELKTKLDKKNNHSAIIHFPGNGTTIYFSSYGKDGSTGKDIYRAHILPDGSYSVPEKLSGGVNTDADEDYCFMHSDGITLFFSSTGHNSMGGYDVFRSNYDAANNHFGEAVNLDFAINTPDDDIFYIADSLKQKAYFASGRSSDLDHLHVYNVMVESTPLQVVYFKGNYSNEINPEENGFGYSLMEKASGRVVCNGNARSADGGYISYVPKSGEYIMSVITSQSPKVHEVALNIPLFDKPVAIRQEAKLIDQNGDKLLVNTFFDTPLNEDLSALASDMLRNKARLEVNAQVPQVAGNKEENATMSTYERTMENAAMIAGFGSGVTVEGIISTLQSEIENLEQQISDAKMQAAQSTTNAAISQTESQKLITQATAFRASGNPENRATIDSLVFQMKLLSKADSLLILAAVYHESAKSLPKITLKKSDALTRKKNSLNALDSMYRAGNNEAVISFLTKEKSNPEGIITTDVLQEFENANSQAKENLLREEAKLISLRNKELETSDDIKSNEAILARSTDPSERESAEGRLKALQQELALQRQRISDQKIAISAAHRKVIESGKLLSFLKNPEQNMAKIEAQNFSLETPISDPQFEAKQTNLNSKWEAMQIRDDKLYTLVEQAMKNAQGLDLDAKTTTESFDTSAQAQPIHTQPNSIQPPTSTEKNEMNDSTAVTRFSESEIAGMRRISQLEAIHSKELQLAKGRPDSLQIIATADYHILSALWAEKVKLDKTLNSGNATKEDSIAFHKVESAIESIASSNAKGISQLTDADLEKELLRQDPDYSEKRSELIQRGDAFEMIDYKLQLIDQLMLARSENASDLSRSSKAELLSALAKRDEEIERALFTMISDGSEMEAARMMYDSTMKILIESDMDYPQKIARQYELTLKYEKQLTQLYTAAKINAIDDESMPVRFVSSERNAIQVKLIGYKKELDRITQADSDNTSLSEASSNQSTQETQTNTESVLADEIASSVSNSMAADSLKSESEARGQNIISDQEVVKTENQTIAENTSLNTNIEAGSSTSDNTPAKAQGQGNVSDFSEPVKIDSSAEYLEKAQTAKQEAGPLWQSNTEVNPQDMLTRPSQIGYTQVISSPQFKSMLWTSQSGKPIPRLKEYEKNEIEIENIDIRLQAEKGNLDTLRALDARKNKLLSIQNKIEIENAEEFSKIVKRSYNEQRLVTDQRMANLSASVRNRSVLSEAMLGKLRKADSLMVESVILKSEAAWAYNEEEKADLYKMALAKQIQSLEILRQVELIANNSKTLLALSDNEIQLYTRQGSAVISTDIASNQKNEVTNANPQETSSRDVSENKSDRSPGNDNPPSQVDTQELDLTVSPVIPDNRKTSDDQVTSTSQGNNADISPPKDNQKDVINPSISGIGTDSDNIAVRGDSTSADSDKPIYIDPYKPEEITAITMEPGTESTEHTLISDEKIPSEKEQREMSKPEQAQWLIKALREPEELMETEVYHTEVMQELIKQQSADQRIKNKEQLIQLNEQILLLEDQMSLATSNSQLRRLDYQREELYTQRASIEIENAAVINELAKHEYNDRKLSADSILTNAEKQGEINPAIQQILRAKTLQADSLLIQSLLFRAEAENGREPLERAYYYREGFACQVKAIELLQQVKLIVNAGSSLSAWSASDIALMKNGKLPAVLTTQVAPNTGVSDIADIEKQKDAQEKSITSGDSNNANTSKEENIADNNSGSNIPLANGTSPAVANASEVKTYFYQSPERVTSELSLLNVKGVYSVNNPIPVDAPLPKGVYYKVQVGAFRNKIPQNLFDGFAPVHGETVKNGVVRYTAGFYMTLERAKTAKNQIRDLGYKDAFVVAYKDGVRIPIYDAVLATEGKEAAEVFASANRSSAPAEKTNASQIAAQTDVKTETTTQNPPLANTSLPVQVATPPSAPLVTGYTKDYKDAAPSTEVESIEGVFFTVQVGVYTTPVPLKKLFNLKPLNTELTETKKIRYTTGRYDTLEVAIARRDEIRTIGVKDAFVTAYYNGRRITVAEALERMKK